MSQKIGYIRVSSTSQNLARQLQSIELDKVFEDKCSAKNADRPGLKNMIDYARGGDEIYVHDLSRLARNMADLLNLVEMFRSKGVSLRFLKENLVFSSERNALNDLMLGILGSIYAFERDLIKERQMEGIQLAKDKGLYKGKKANLELYCKISELFSNGMNKRAIALELNISRPTVYRALSSPEVN